MSLLFLDDFLSTSNLQSALRSVCPQFRSRLELPGEIDELGVVCPDVEKAAAHLNATYPRTGPFFLGSGPPRRFEQFGVKKNYRTRVGFGYCDGVLIELAEPGTGSDIFAEHLDPGGRITLHHLGFYSRGRKLKIKRKKYLEIMQSQGYEPWTKGEVRLQGISTNICIFKTYDQANGLAIEFLDTRLFGPKGPKIPMPRFLIEMLARRQMRKGPRVMEL